MGMRVEKDSILIRTARMFDDITASVISGTLLIVFVFTVWTLADMSDFNSHGAEAAEGHDLNELCISNPDTVAWLKMEGTNIDYPVVRGKDNFEYLDLDINREFYVGGTLFLDSGNSRDLGDKYNVIHGHHMAEGLMFGDLDRYLDAGFMSKCRGGYIETPDEKYMLEVFAAGRVNAYDSGIYNLEVDMGTHISAIKRSAEYICDPPGKPDKILVLSTCTEDMDDSRTVVFCRMKRVADHRTGRR